MQLNGMDPPRHTYLRRIAQKAFTPATARAREPEFREIANRLVDDFIDRGSADLVDVFASKFPLYTASAMLGLDPDLETAAEMKQYATDAVVLSVDPVTDAQLDEAMVRAIRFDRFMRGVIEERRKSLGDDVVSLLIKARDDESDQALNDTELVSVVTQSLVGGIDTTGALITRMAYVLLSVPERWDRVCADPGTYAGTVVEETLRMHGPHSRGGPNHHPRRRSRRHHHSCGVVRPAPYRLGQPRSVHLRRTRAVRHRAIGRRAQPAARRGVGRAATIRCVEKRAWDSKGSPRRASS